MFTGFAGEPEKVCIAESVEDFMGFHWRPDVLVNSCFSKQPDVSALPRWMVGFADFGHFSSFQIDGIKTCDGTHCF